MKSCEETWLVPNVRLETSDHSSELVAVYLLVAKRSPCRSATFAIQHVGDIRVSQVI